MRITVIAFAVTTFAAVTVEAQPSVVPPVVPPLIPPLTQTSAQDDYSPAAFGGNLRVDLQCADYFATYDSGLRVTIDGTPSSFVAMNGEIVTSYTRHGVPIDSWVPTDAGYVATPGRHHVDVSAPGCGSYSTELDVPTIGPRFIEGWLETTGPALRGTAAAPNGFTNLLGAYVTMRSGERGGIAFGQQSIGYRLDQTQFTGLYYAAAFERRHFVVGMDLELGAGTIAGDVQNESATVDALHSGGRLRFGYRFPLHDLAISVGSGVGADIWSLANWHGADNVLAKPSPLEGDWYVPLWASVTYKPSCNWGVQVTASYDLQPTDPSASEPTVEGGIIYQPNDACSQPVGVTVR